MKILYGFVNSISVTSNHRQSTNQTQSHDTTDHKHSFVLDKLVFPRDK